MNCEASHDLTRTKSAGFQPHNVPAALAACQQIGQARRCYNLVGQTLDTMRVWDITRGIQLLRQLQHITGPLIVSGAGKQAENVLLASLFFSDPSKKIYVLTPNWSAPGDEPDHLNLLRFTTWDELKNLGVRPWLAAGALIQLELAK